MTRLLSTAAALALVMGLGTGASANDWFGAQQNDVYSTTSKLPLVAIGGGNGTCGCNASCDGNSACGCDGACDYDDCCDCGCGSWFVDADLLLFQYQSNFTFINGVSNFNYNASPRVVLGYQNADGLGVRMRFWDYNYGGTSVFGPINVNTFNIDAEAFQTVQLGCQTTLDLSAGIRYNDYDRTFTAIPALRTTFTGFGGIAGIKARRQMLGGAGYANVNHAVLVDDLSFPNAGAGASFSNTIVTQTELGTGYEWISYTDSGAKVWLRAGYEWWNWTGYTITNGNNGFSGFVLGGGMQF